MNSFRLELEKLPDGPSWWGNIYADHVLINDRWHMDWVAMAKSAIQGGEYYFFTCSCSYPECAGIHDPVAVTHSKELISWDIIKPDPERHLEFSKKEYREALLKFFREVDLSVPSPSIGRDYQFGHEFFQVSTLERSVKILETGFIHKSEFE